MKFIVNSRIAFVLAAHNADAFGLVVQDNPHAAGIFYVIPCRDEIDGLRDASGNVNFLFWRVDSHLAPTCNEIYLKNGMNIIGLSCKTTQERTQALVRGADGKKKLIAFKFVSKVNPDISFFSYFLIQVVQRHTPESRKRDAAYRSIYCEENGLDYYSLERRTFSTKRQREESPNQRRTRQRLTSFSTSSSEEVVDGEESSNGLNSDADCLAEEDTEEANNTLSLQLGAYESNNHVFDEENEFLEWAYNDLAYLDDIQLADTDIHSIYGAEPATATTLENIRILRTAIEDDDNVE